MGTEIHPSLTQDLPQNFWGKILGATPVVMTVVATLLAGLSSSEMNRAEYDRGLAAQLQAKASDEWNYFQAKKLRSALQADFADLMGAKSDLSLPVSSQRAVSAMPASVQAALAAATAGKPDEAVDALVAKCAGSDLDAARKIASARLDQFDRDLAKAAQPADRAGKLRFASARYDAESRLDQDVASVYDLLVRKGNLSAVRHHQRSQLFFFGMLVAQTAVVISTFALAARQKSVLWTIAAIAGVASFVFALYVYLWM